MPTCPADAAAVGAPRAGHQAVGSADAAGPLAAPASAPGPLHLPHPFLPAEKDTSCPPVMSFR